MSTKSEDLFDAYCADRGYAVEELAAGSALGKTPDRLVTTPLGQVVVEIKELTPSEDDLRQIRELAEKRWTVGGGTPGARAFEMIRRAAPQLKRYADRNLPCVLVAFDNIGLNEPLQSKHLEPSFIDFGMYGLQTVLLAPETADSTHYVAVGSGRGGRRQMTPDNRDYISAVSVLQPLPIEGHAILTYHNYFARLPLHLGIFRGGSDMHFRKPGHPSETPQMWAEV